MKPGRILTLFIIFLTTSTAFAQIKDSIPLIVADSLKAVYIYADTGKAINRVDAQGRKQGLWEKRYPDGKIRYRGRFLNDNPKGVFKYFWDNDSIQNIATYSDNGKIAYSHMFYENGGMFSVGKFVNEKKDSIWLYYDEGLKLYKKEQYVLGKKDGKWSIFYSNGRVQETKCWHNDLENGPYQKFYENGQTQEDATYVNGKMEGPIKIYEAGDSNIIIVRGNYHNDLKDGRWILFNTEQNKKDTLIYKNGKLLNAAKYKLTQRQLDSARIQNHELQEKLDHPQNIEDQYNR